MAKFISTMEHFNEMKKSPVLIIYFTTPSYEPCQKIAPHFEKLAEKYSCNSVIFAECNIIEARDVPSHCQVKTVPYFVFFRDGEKVGDHVGSDPGELDYLVQRLAIVLP